MTRALLVATCIACSAPAPSRPPPHEPPAPLAGKRVTPTRLCYAGDALVFEHDCGCNDALVCSVDRVDGTRVTISLATDPTRPHQCDDCFAMVPARCPLATRPLVVVVNTLPIELPADGCWSAGH